MMYYVVTREHAYTMEPFVQGWDGLRLLFYDDLFRVPALPAGAYVWVVSAVGKDVRSGSSEQRRFSLEPEALRLEVHGSDWK